MIELDAGLAQDIVDRAMAILPYNINVMDTRGLIIGSGDRQRLHTRHEGAQLVLSNQRVVELDAQAAACLQGVRPGVNLPLFNAGQLVGVLGITGDPEEVRPFAELVRMAAEMLVEQRALQAERQWQEQQLQRWLSELLDSDYPLPALASELERLELTLHWPLQAALICLDGRADATHQLRERTGPLLLPLGRHQLLWLRSPQEPEADQAWLAQAERRAWPVTRLLVAEPVERLAELREACQALGTLRDYADAAQAARLLYLADQQVLVLLYAQRRSWLVQRLLAPVRALRQVDGQGVLEATLRDWLECGAQSQLCAQRLGIHRNTLRYRLERISRVTGLELFQAEPRQRLSLALALLQGVERD
ncbi:CdaR family transcriptional regulator [Pseudomonas sp. WN033]|nr:CdaR family transcriptional regulator [Pseudomonas sp. WN033]